MKKAAICIFGMATILSSCGGGSSSSKDPAPEPEESPEDTGPVNYGDVAIYLRGDMNGWQIDDNFKLEYSEETLCYYLKASIPAANNSNNTVPTEHKFKVANEDWIDVNIGGYALEGTSLIDRTKSLVELGNPLVLNARIRLPGDSKEAINALPDPKELLLSATEDAERTFTLCFPDNDPNTPQLTVE